jgi:hypothetical protein
MSPKNLDHRCRGRAKSGRRCGAAATAGGLCFFHANPDKASELGRIGGGSNRHHADENVDPLRTLASAIAMQETVTWLIADGQCEGGPVHSGSDQSRVSTPDPVISVISWINERAPTHPSRVARRMQREN